MDSRLAFAGLVRQAELLRSREVSSAELVELYLTRIEALGRRLNAYRVVRAEPARAEAAEADRRLAAGDDGPLLGVPIAVKDTADVAGEVTALGTACFDEPARDDDVMVQSLREAGAVILGKTNLPELAIHGFTESKTWGATRNPWDPERTPGGSSGGSGAAVAAGLAAGASASDGAGSIRFPAAHCNLFGLKPQRRRIPFGGRSDPHVEHWLGLSVNGCITQTVLDTALWLDATAARDDAAPPRPAQPFAEAARSRPERLRIGWSVKPPRLLAPTIVADEVRVATEATARLLAGLGHEVFPADADYGLAGNRVTARFLGGIRNDIRATPNRERLEARTRGFARLAAAGGGEWAARSAVRGEQGDAARVLAVFDRCDALLTPTTGTPAFEVGKWEGRGALRTLLGESGRYPFGAMWNHLGNPAAAVPAGFTDDGLPLSVQLVGRPNDEATLLSLAAQLEAERPWTDRRPPVS